MPLGESALRAGTQPGHPGIDVQACVRLIGSGNCRTGPSRSRPSIAQDNVSNGSGGRRRHIVMPKHDQSAANGTIGGGARSDWSASRRMGARVDLGRGRPLRPRSATGRRVMAAPAVVEAACLWRAGLSRRYGTATGCSGSTSWRCSATEWRAAAGSAWPSAWSTPLPCWRRRGCRWRRYWRRSAP